MSHTKSIDLSSVRSRLPVHVANWVESNVIRCQPRDIHILDGTDTEDAAIKKNLVKSGILIPLPKYDNCFLARTDPRDVARVEGRTVIATRNKLDTVPDVAEGVDGYLGRWIDPDVLTEKVEMLFPGCMKGRTMYVIVFSMGSVGGSLSRIGVELTDSAYVAVSMRIMTRIGTRVIDHLKKTGEDFVKCLHSVGCPLMNGEKDVAWPCQPEKTIIAHLPESNEVMSFGSGYGGNSLLGKKCFALRIGSNLAQKQGWLAEHMLIMGIKSPGSDERRYIAAAFPSACGKTNLAMMKPTLPGYEITCVGDDIAWMGFRNGKLRAINPENGFFGVCPGTSTTTNPVAMKTIFKNTIFTNTALTSDGGTWWEGMTSSPPDGLMIDWTGKPWSILNAGERKAAHPNSRFCAPAINCPILDSNWELHSGVPIDAILFGGRRPKGVPLVVEATDWEHGVFMGATLRSEATAAAEFKGKVVMHDPFSMRPFFGYNFGLYLSHWLKIGKDASAKNKLPKIFMVNWFRLGDANNYLWPGFGENSRVIDWILRRCELGPNEDDHATRSAIGWIPSHGALRLDGLANPVNLDELLSVPVDFWKDEVAAIRIFFHEQVGSSLPCEMKNQLESLSQRLH